MPCGDALQDVVLQVGASSSRTGGKSSVESAFESAFESERAGAVGAGAVTALLVGLMAARRARALRKTLQNLRRCACITIGGDFDLQRHGSIPACCLDICVVIAYESPVFPRLLAQAMGKHLL
jgi:hypothetical protein